MEFIVNSLGVLLILAIVWWFWLYKQAEAQITDKTNVVDILVDNGIYTPSVIQAPLDQTITLRFIRKDPSPCASTVVFSDFGISRELPMNRATAVTLIPDKEGEYHFTCQMAMYRGTLKVIEMKE